MEGIRTFAEQEKETNKEIAKNYPGMAPVSYGSEVYRSANEALGKRKKSSEQVGYQEKNAPETVYSEENAKVEEDDYMSSESKPNDVGIDLERIVAMASGGAFVGGLTGTIPGAIVGALAGGLFGLRKAKKK